METERIALSQRERERLRVLHQVKEKHLTQVEAAERLKLTDRQVRRLLLAVEKRGDGAVNHGLRGAVHRIASIRQGWHDADGDGRWNAATSIAARRWRVLGRWDAIATAATRSGGVIGQARKKCCNLEIEVI